MNYSQLEYYVSQPRINRFLRACGNSKSKAQKLYKINLRVSQAFYPLLNLFEIFLRNTIHNHIATHFNHKPKTVNRSILSAKLKRIREFRNRIYHNEPICFKGTAIDFSTANNIMNDIHDVIKWINPVLLGYTEYFNNINSKIAIANTL